jgi:hypothetical protein
MSSVRITLWAIKKLNHLDAIFLRSIFLPKNKGKEGMA